jgi:hypothetical protein
MSVPGAVKPCRTERAKVVGPGERSNDTDLELCDLTVEVPRGQTLTQQFDTEPVNATDGVDGSRFRHRDGPHRVLSH